MDWLQRQSGTSANTRLPLTRSLELRRFGEKWHAQTSAFYAFYFQAFIETVTFALLHQGEDHPSTGKKDGSMAPEGSFTCLDSWPGGNPQSARRIYVLAAL